MNQIKTIVLILIAAFISLASTIVEASEIVTVDNFVRAETDMTLKRYVDQGAFGTVFHIRQPVPIDKQDVIRMNRDTLYSVGIFDLTNPVTITKPKSDGRFQSMLFVNQDHSIQPPITGAGDFTLTREKIGTRYVFVIFRTFADPTNSDDIKAANSLQDRIKFKQKNVGSFEIPDWDLNSLKKMRDAINVLAATKPSSEGLFGDKSKMNPIDHLLGTAYGWGGNPREGAMYLNVVPKNNDGKKPYVLRAKDVPVNGFWSVTLYNEKGFMEKNDLNAYSYNNVTAKKDADGGITIHFGGDPRSSNYLPIMKGWNYVIRLYQPKKELLNGSWKFPDPKPAE